VAVLILAGIGALAANQRLRRGGLVVDAIHLTPAFTPGCDCPRDRAKISFRIKGPDEVDLDILDSDGDPVRRLAENRTLPDREVTVFHWDGRTDSGAPAPPGTYTLRIHERRRDRTITPPGEETVLGGSQ
jgi:hypothetical protein